jgi:hypothetical protein
MIDSGYVLPTLKAKRLVSNYKHDNNGKLVAVGLLSTFNISRPKFLGSKDGLIFSTIRDYWRFSQIILNGGKFEDKHYLKAGIIEIMHTNILELGVRLRFYRRDIDGLGFSLDYTIV